MSDDPIDPAATEEAGSTPVPGDGEPKNKEERRGFIGSARRNLSEREASSAAGRRWLIAEVERLELECDQLKAIRDDNTDLRVSIARLEESQKTVKWLEILSYISVSIGSAGIGATPSYINAPNLEGVGLVLLGASIILVAVGVWSKVARS